MESEITLQIILTRPTHDVIYGLQKGSGSNYETVQKQIFSSGDLSFKFTIKVKGDRSKDKLPRFSGSYVHGSPDNKFVYIDIGKAAGQTDSIWSRRLKIPLTVITWEEIDSFTENPNLIMETHVPGTGKDGSPNCATVKPFGGWHCVKPVKSYPSY
jgi:hypothetical protein